MNKFELVKEGSLYSDTVRSHVWGEGDGWGRSGPLYGEVQYVMGNGNMVLPPPRGRTDTASLANGKKLLEPTTSCLRNQNVSTEPVRQLIERIVKLTLISFIQRFIRFAHFTELPYHFK